MKFSTALLAFLLPLAITAAPTSSADNGHDGHDGHDNHDDRDYHISCKVYDQDARYRTCPKTSCDLKGQYHKGHWEDFYCYKWGDYVNGNNKWYRDHYGYYSNAYWWGSCSHDGWLKEC